MNSKSTGLLKNLLLLIVTLAVTLAMIEFVLQVADFPKQSIKLERVYDPVLLYKLPSDYSDVNADGFRNHGIPEHADIVTLGDSHTYGYNVPQEETWPSQIAMLTGLSVYNMGVGGYGPLQYFYLLDKALSLKPRYVLVGLYVANDIKGICDLYLKTDYWKSEAKKHNLDLQYCNDAVPSDAGRRKNKFRKKAGLANGLSEALSDTKIATLVDLGARLARSYVPFHTGSFIVLNDERNRLHMVNKEVRNNRDYMDLQRPEISRSLAVTKGLLFRMAERSKQSGAQLVVLLIPSKSTVLNDYQSSKNKSLPTVYQDSARNEGIVGGNIKAWLEQQGIPFADARSSVVKALENSGNVYPLTGDDHPVAAGYRAYAEALYEGYFEGMKH